MPLVLQVISDLFKEIARKNYLDTCKQKSIFLRVKKMLLRQDRDSKRCLRGYNNNDNSSCKRVSSHKEQERRWKLLERSLVFSLKLRALSCVQCVETRAVQTRHVSCQ
jgi:hypothetical protein